MGAPTAAAGTDASQGHLTGYGSRPYRTYVLTALLIIYILNFVDRSLLSIVARPLRADIPMSDTAFGLLTGFGFAFLYTFLGLPIARIAERKNRVIIMAISLVMWSVMTALCGLSQEVTIGSLVIGGFWILLVCRVGVGIGEAGCTPPANSLIADYFPPDKRSTALGFYAMGVTLGTTVASLIGGPITDAFGWRMAFIVLGLPGVAVALIMYLTVREPPRGYSDPPDAKKSEKASLSEGLKELFTKPSFWTMTAGATIAAFCGYAIANFQSLYLQRTFEITAGQASVYFNAPSYAAGAVGTILLGWLAEKLRSKSITAIAWLSAGGLFLCVPFYLFAFNSMNMTHVIIGIAAGHFIKYGYLAAQYTIGQGVVSMRVRATATAVLLFVVNLIGYGLGPLFIGAISDAKFSSDLQAAGYESTVTRGMCDRAQSDVLRAKIDFRDANAGAELSAQGVNDVIAAVTDPRDPGVSWALDEAQYAFCEEANAASTRLAMLITSVLYAFGGLMFLFCMFTLKRDLVAK